MEPAFVIDKAHHDIMENDTSPPTHCDCEKVHPHGIQDQKNIPKSSIFTYKITYIWGSKRFKIEIWK